MQQGTESWIWGVCSDTVIPEFGCVSQGQHFLSTPQSPSCSYSHHCNSLQTRGPIPWQPIIFLTDHGHQKYKWDHLTPYLTWPQGPSWSDWASSLSTLRSHPFPPTSFSLTCTVLLPEMSVLLKADSLLQISGKYHFCRGRHPSPPV